MTNSPQSIFTVDDLPDEILDYILSLIPPYKDLKTCKLVCKRWRRIAEDVIRTKKRSLLRAIAEFDIYWETITPADMTPTITKRYSHCAAVHNNSMYVFGGCTCSMTTFNDLWRLDLSKREWVRPLAMGIYPSPKACSSMVCYGDTLILFGGWTYPSTYPLHQTWQLFNELHIYDIKLNQWKYKTDNIPPPMAGHSVSLHGNKMVVFGGIQNVNILGMARKSNDVWFLNLDTLEWFKPKVIGARLPDGRYGHTQTALDAHNALILGGCGGANDLFSDAWVLRICPDSSGDSVEWRTVRVVNPGNAPAKLWCNPACKIGEKMVVLYRNKGTPNIQMSASKTVEGFGRVLNREPDRKEVLPDKDDNVNGKRGVLGRKSIPDCVPPPEEPQPPAVTPPQQRPSFSRLHHCAPRPAPLRLSAFNDPPSPSSSRHSHLLNYLKQAEERIKSNRSAAAAAARPSNNINNNNNDPNCKKATASPSPKKQKRNTLGMYVLDISHALDEDPYVEWLTPRGAFGTCNVPEDTVLYSLVEGEGELIMFGGIKGANSLISPHYHATQVSNSLHFITAPRNIV